MTVVSTCDWITYVPAASAAVASLAFALSVAKQISDRNFSREVEAKKAWREYLQFAFDHPKFSSGYGGEPTDLLEFEKYEWFVSKMLFAAEEVLAYSPNSTEWRAVIRTQIGYHCNYFLDRGAIYIDQYAPVLRDLIRQECNA